MGDGTAGLCSHLPCVADIAHTAGCHAEFNKEYSMKSKRALDISALPPIENLKIGSFGYRCPEPLFKYGPVIHKGYYLCYILEGKGCFQYGRQPLLFFIKGTGLLNRTGCHHLVSGGKNLALGICLAGTAGAYGPSAPVFHEAVVCKPCIPL